MSNKHVETYHFSNLDELRDWLNAFKTTDLTTVLPNIGDYFVLGWYEQTLSDGSKVQNVTLRDA